MSRTANFSVSWGGCLCPWLPFLLPPSSVCCPSLPGLTHASFLMAPFLLSSQVEVGGLNQVVSKISFNFNYP